MNCSESIKELASALSKAQGEMGAAEKDSVNPFFKSKYADLMSVISCLKVPFSKYGLSYTQFPICTPNSAGVVTRIMHSSGEWMESEYLLPMTGKLDPQAFGSAITYARRYALQSIAGIPTADDDSELAMGRQPTQSINFKQEVKPYKKMTTLKSNGNMFNKPVEVVTNIKDKIDPEISGFINNEPPTTKVLSNEMSDIKKLSESIGTAIEKSQSAEDLREIYPTISNVFSKYKPICDCSMIVETLQKKCAEKAKGFKLGVENEK